MDKMWKGSSRKLLGDCMVLSVFVSDDDEQKWSEEDKNKTLKILDKAIDWIGEQGAEYEVEFSFESVCLNPRKDIRIDVLPTWSCDIKLKADAFQQIMEQLGYDDATAFYEYIKNEYDGYNIAVLFFMNQEERSYMHPLKVNHPDEFLDINVNYKSPSTHLPYISTVAHELLHAFTAQDLYNVAVTPEGEAAWKRAAARFPKEIMLYCGNDVSENVLSEYTAFLIGWHSEPQKWYLDIAQPGNKKSLEQYMRTHANFDDDGELIIEEETHVAYYFNDDRELNRYMVNSNDYLHIWREYINETEEEIEYTETWESDADFYLTSQTDGTKITVCKKGGWSWQCNTKTGKYDKQLFQMTLGDVSTYGEEDNDDEEDEDEDGEHIEYFYNDDREFNKYLMRNNRYTWWEYINETEEEWEYKETGTDQNYYFLQSVDDDTKITIPKKGGTCWKYNHKTRKYEPFYKIERGDVEDYDDDEE